MDKKTFDIPSTQDGKWGSYISKYPADSGKVLASAFIKDTRNVVTALTGQAQKIQGGLLWNPNSSLGAAPLDQYEAIFESGTRLLIYNVAGTLKASSGNNLFTDIATGFSSEANFEFSSYQDRVYGDNGVDSPIVLDIVTNYGGVSYSFGLAKSRPMGAQPPASAPTVALDTDSTINQVPAGAHTYKITFVYYNGQEESNGGPASTPVTNDASHTSNDLSAIPVGGYGVSGRNIYRDDNDGNWLLLDFINDNTTTVYTDILPIGATPTPIPTTNGLPPVFKYIANWLDRNFVAGVEGAPGSIFWSIAGEPDVFDPANTIICRNDDIITGLYVFGGLLYVFGQHSVGTILGTTDTSFYYSPISTTVGCVDNRSIAVRSLISVPTMIWLSALPNRGWYYTQGSVVQFMSEFIDDLALNISQVQFLQRSNTQNTKAQYEGDTSSPGIDLDSNPGAIRTITPQALFENAAAWASGTITDLVISGDQLTTILSPKIDPLTGGVFGGSVVPNPSYGALIPSTAGFTGQDNTGNPDQEYGNSPNEHYAAQQVIPAVSGNITHVSILFHGDGSTPVRFFSAVDSLGLPSTITYLTGGVVPTSGVHIITIACAVPATAGVPVWLGVSGGPSSNVSYIPNIFAPVGNDVQSVFTGPALYSAPGTPGSWVAVPSVTPGGTPSGTIETLSIGYTFVPTPSAAAGNWTSPVFDSLSDYNDGANMGYFGPSDNSDVSSTTVTISGSNSPTGPFTLTDTLVDPPSSGTTMLTGGAYRYWQIIATLTTSDTSHFASSDPAVAVAYGGCFLFFNPTGVWLSPVVATTADATSLDTLVASVVLPNVDASYTLEIRTSPTGTGSWTAYGAIGSATPDNFAQLRLTLVTGSATSSGTIIPGPMVSSVELDWTISSTIESSAIDTGTVPSGWGTFQYDSVGAGTVSFFFRTASSSGGLPAATYVAVPNGGIPSSAVLEFVQWKGVLGASATSVPQIDSVTVNWLLGGGVPTRCASVFFNKSYYCAVAFNDSPTNNLLIEFDQDGLWRIHSIFRIGTLGTYFNDLYYGSSLTGDVLNAFKQDTENGVNINMDVRTKANDYGDKLRLKTVRSLKVTGVGTGTLIHAYYSLDRGDTWIELLNSSGTLGFQTPTDGEEFVEFFVPDFSGNFQTGGRTVAWRIVSADALPCQILQISPTVYVRKGKALREITGF